VTSSGGGSSTQTSSGWSLAGRAPANDHDRTLSQDSSRRQAPVPRRESGTTGWTSVDNVRASGRNSRAGLHARKRTSHGRTTAGHLHLPARSVSSSGTLARERRADDVDAFFVLQATQVGAVCCLNRRSPSSPTFLASRPRPVLRRLPSHLVESIPSSR
jgi:hypothetical protein